MKNIRIDKFSPLIKSVGIEFEGFFDNDYLDSLTGKKNKGSSKNQSRYLSHKYERLIDRIATDGSVSGYYQTKVAREIKTVVCSNNVKIANSLRLFRYLQDSELYEINKSCGLHFHIQVSDELVPFIVNKEFVDGWHKLFKKLDSKVFEDRQFNRYCKTYLPNRKFELARYFNMTGSRYQSVNYSSYSKYKTIEFRLYGGANASIVGLAKLINKTISYINSYAKQASKCKHKIRRFSLFEIKNKPLAPERELVI